MQLTCSNQFRSHLFHRIYPLALVLVWSIGLVTGLYLTNRIPVESLSLMHMLELSHVSIVCVLLVRLFPFLISILLMRYLPQYLILPFVLFEGIQYSYCSCLFSIIYGSAAWLVRAVIFFSANLSAPVLLFLWLVFPGSEGSSRRWIVCGVLAVPVLFALSPYWEVLLK